MLSPDALDKLQGTLEHFERKVRLKVAQTNEEQNRTRKISVC